MRRVAVCITALELGGAEAMLLEVLRHRPADVEFRVFSLMSGGQLASQVEALGVPVTGLGMRRGVPSLPALLRLARLLKEYRPDLVHTWMYHADLIGGVAARIAGVPRVVWHVHNASLARDRSKWSTRAVVWLLARLSRRVPDAVLYCAESARADHLRRGYPAEGAVVVPNGVDTDRYRADAAVRTHARAELGIDGEEFVIGRIGSWDPQKDWPGMIDAAGRFCNASERGRFVFVGREIEPGNAVLARLVEEAGVRPRSLLLGLRDDVDRLLPALDVFTSSSAGEAFPVSIVEAMSCEVPCVVTDAGDSALIVGDTGVVVPPGDPAALADAWLAIVAEGAEARRERGARARARVLAEYDISSVAERVFGVYRSLIGDGTGS